MNDLLETTIISLGICVVLPCVIVFLVVWSRKNEINRKTEVALKALEHGAEIDPNFFANPKVAKKMSVKAKIFSYLVSGLVLTGLGLSFTIVALFAVLPDINQFNKLMPGAILLLLGVAFIGIYFIARKQFAAEIKAEEENLKKAE